MVVLFHRSPTSNDDVLQKYVKAEFGKELQLLFDCKTRWNSLLTMLEPFNLLKDCVLKSLIDLKNPVTFSSSELVQVGQLVSGLEPIKVTVEALCRRDANLLTAEAALQFMMKKLNSQTQTSPLAHQLLSALRRRISERRSSTLSGVLRYLHNPAAANDSSDDDEADPGFELSLADSTIFHIPNSSHLKKAISGIVMHLMSPSGSEPDRPDAHASMGKH